MSGTHIATIVCLLALSSCTCALVRMKDVISLCRHRCHAEAASGADDVGFGDCFDACIESSSMAAQWQQLADEGGHDLSNIEWRPETSEVVASEAGNDRKRSGATQPMLWSKVFPRGAGSGSASKYLRIGRSGNEIGEEEAPVGLAEGGDEKLAVEVRRMGSSDRASSSLLSGRLGNSAKSYLRVGKKSAEKVNEH